MRGCAQRTVSTGSFVGRRPKGDGSRPSTMAPLLFSLHISGSRPKLSLEPQCMHVTTLFPPGCYALADDDSGAHLHKSPKRPAPAPHEAFPAAVPCSVRCCSRGSFPRMPTGHTTRSLNPFWYPYYADLSKYTVCIGAFRPRTPWHRAEPREGARRTCMQSCAKHAAKTPPQRSHTCTGIRQAQDCCHTFG